MIKYKYHNYRKVMTNYRDIGAVTYLRLSTRLMSYQLAIAGAVLMIDVRYLCSDCACYLPLTTYHLLLATCYLLLITDY